MIPGNHYHVKNSRLGGPEGPKLLRPALVATMAVDATPTTRAPAAGPRLVSADGRLALTGNWDKSAAD
jgi:hypothetical protein